MENLKIIWIIIFFFFSLCLIFIWSKILVLFKRTTAIIDLLKSFDLLDADSVHSDLKTTEESAPVH
ncbi:MAG: hypothetical protein JW863_10220 [Chitinispirillaceae bacterium]|nr:hypothetical protein [Chitinispirillaceae bacterium]